ncbi:MAG: ATP-grasp domain-containing protein [Clostridiaceae bacterium]
MDIAGKKLLILGANPETAGFVIKAHEMGVYTIVTDYDPHAFAKRYASKSYDIDAIDVDALYQMAVSEQIDGVMVGVAEALLSTYEQLCSRLQLPCFGSARLFDLLADKSRFKQTCREHGVPVVEEYELSEHPSEEELAAIPLPVVVKPVDNRSSRGISVCRTQEELKTGISKALDNSKRKKLIIEKYMTGDEVVIYYLIQDGEPSLVGMCDRYTNKEQYGLAQLPTAYLFPSIYLKQYCSATDEKVKQMLRDIGVKNGTLFIQSFIEDGEVRFYESGFRLNGAQEHYIVSAVSGIDAKEHLVHFALTGKMSEEILAHKAKPDFDKWGCKLSPLVRTGQIHTLGGLEEIAKIPEMLSINPSYGEGDIVTAAGTLRQIACRFFFVTETKQRLAEIIEFIQTHFIVQDSDGRSMLLTPFDVNTIFEKYGSEPEEK